jgi:hypothetical protein
VDHNLGWDEAF